MAISQNTGNLDVLISHNTNALVLINNDFFRYFYFYLFSLSLASSDAVFRF